MERQFLLDPDNEVHLYALQFIYMPRINNALSLFVDQWNNHPIRTAANHSPLQLWTKSFYEIVSCGGTYADRLLEEPVNSSIEDEGPIPEIQTSNNVIIPRSTLDLNEEQITMLNELFNWETDDRNYGMQLYSNVVDYIETITLM